MTDRFLNETTELLERTPRVLHDLLGGLPEKWLDGRATRPTAGNRVTSSGTCARGSFRPGVSNHRARLRSDRFAHNERDRDVPLPDLLDRFSELRAANLDRLRELVTTEDLDRVGRHPSLGDVTMRELLATWAVHDLDHVSQAFAAMSATYDETVGPWKAYLGILLRPTDPSAVPG